MTDRDEIELEKECIPKCDILGVKIAAINKQWLLPYLINNINCLSGEYICVSNVHTTVLSYDDPDYCLIQNNSLMAIPDGGPLSSVARKKGFKKVSRITGPSLMEEIFELSEEYGYTHYFYGSTEETLNKLRDNVIKKYPNINIVGLYSPPFRPLTEAEDMAITAEIAKSNANFIWIGLGAPKQEIWMANHCKQFSGLMIGVGAGFDYFAGNIKRAPQWMQNNNLEWLYRLMQDPKRLFKRYFYTNTKFLWLLFKENRF